MSAAVATTPKDMKDFARRLDNLEAGNGLALSPSARTWLGQSLSAEEQRSLEVELVGECAPIDTSGFSLEARRWLAR